MNEIGSSIAIAIHQNDNIVSSLISAIEENLPYAEIELNDLKIDEYRQIILNIQNIINTENFGRKIIKSIFEEISTYLGTDSFLIQSNIYLRASRPQQSIGQENIGWHRETFYGSNMQKAVNVWTPIKGLNSNNTLQYIPDSHLIPEENIIIKKDKDTFTKRYSAGHKLGFQYEPKKIVDGVDFSTKKKLQVPYGGSAIFDGNLIHGAAENNSSDIRFSVDFRILRKKDYTSENKKYHYSSGKPYFEELD